MISLSWLSHPACDEHIFVYLFLNICINFLVYADWEGAVIYFSILGYDVYVLFKLSYLQVPD